MPRPRPVEHFDDRDTDRQCRTSAELAAENTRLRADIAAWRLRYYTLAAGPVSQLRWDPVIPEQRGAPDDEHLPPTHRYQNVRLRRLDL